MKNKLYKKFIHTLAKAKIKSMKKKAEKKENKKQVNSQEEIIYKRFEEDLKMTFGTKVNINRKSKDRGKIEIEYYSQAELERIYEMLKKTQE